MCNEPDCVPIETLIICVGKVKTQSYMVKILKPVVEVLEEDVVKLNVWKCFNDVMRQYHLRLSENTKGDTNEVAIPQDISATLTASPTTAVPVTTNAVKVIMRRKTDSPAIAAVGLQIGIGEASPDRKVVSSSSEKSPLEVVAHTTTGASGARMQARTVVPRHTGADIIPESRHGSKGSSTRPRGCPCCDPVSQFYASHRLCD